jgi:hypothetical protein
MTNNFPLHADLVVTRHPAALDWLAYMLTNEHDEAFADFDAGTLTIAPRADTHDYGSVDKEEAKVIPVCTGNVTAEQVRSKVVVGNLPLQLAALCSEVWAIEFNGPPPRGRDYGVQEMVEAGARLAGYRVAAL